MRHQRRHLRPGAGGRQDPAGGRCRRDSPLLVEADRPGFFRRGRVLDKIGMKEQDTAELGAGESPRNRGSAQADAAAVHSCLGARAEDTPVEAHGLEADGTLYVPRDPTVAGWLAYPEVGPGADSGSAVLTTHVNYAHVLGAFGDLTAYRPGRHIAVTLADGRVLIYHVVPAASMGFPTADTALVVGKAQLDHDQSLRERIFDFTGAWSLDGQPRCGRLVLVTCTGQVIDHNLDNPFVFALPDE